MNDNKTIDVIAVLIYNLGVVAITALSIYYICGWMFFLLIALMNISNKDKE